MAKNCGNWQWQEEDGSVKNTMLAICLAKFVNKINMPLSQRGFF